MTGTIKDTTDKKYIGDVIHFDLLKLTLPSGEDFEVIGRCHIGNGLWRVWNSNYVIDIEEVK